MNAARFLLLARSSILLVVLCLFMPGCGSPGRKSGKPVAWNIKLIKVTGASVEVDLIGISPSELSYWNHVDITKYFATTGDPVREQAADRAKRTRFEEGNEFLLKADDPIWTKWLSYGTSELVILASLPKRVGEGEADQRRRILSIGKKEWQAKGKTIEIEILDSQIRPLTAPKL